MISARKKCLFIWLAYKSNWKNKVQILPKIFRLIRENIQYFFMIFECFPSISTMRTHAQACFRWSKYTTDCLCVQVFPKSLPKGDNLTALYRMACSIAYQNVKRKQNETTYSIQSFWTIHSSPLNGFNSHQSLRKISY